MRLIRVHHVLAALPALTIGLTGDGGESGSTQAATTAFAVVSAGLSHACGVTVAGAAYCWGDNRVGQLGDGTTANRLSPVRVAGDVAFAVLSVGFNHTCALTAAGAAHCWGDNRVGQLGDGTTANRLSPVRVAGDVSFAAVSVGFNHTCGVTAAGVAYCWGSNDAGQVGDGTRTGRLGPARVVAGVRRIATRGGTTCTVNVAAVGAQPVPPPPQPPSAPQPESSRPILYYEELDGRQVLTGVFLNGRRVTIRADNAATMPVWSPDGAWIAYSGVDEATHTGFLALVNLRDERRHLFRARDSVPVLPRWSPDGGSISVLLVGHASDGATATTPETIPLLVISVASQTVRARLCVPSAALMARAQQPKVRWSPDGHKILVAGEIAVVAATGTGIIDTVARQPVTVEWGSTSDVVYYFAQSDSGGSPNAETLGTFYLRRLADSAPTLLAPADRVALLGVPYAFVPPSRRVALSPDGTRLAFWGRRSTDSADVVRVYDLTVDSAVDLGRPSATFRLPGRILGLQWGPDARGLATLVPAERGLEIRHLNLGTGEWKKLATVRAGGAADSYGFGLLSLSWTQ